MKQLFNFSFINLGCTKNLVDTQFLLGKIFSLGNNNPNYQINYFTDPYESDVKFVFLNSCGFISSAREEMLSTISRLTKANKTVYLLGCGLQYYINIAQDTSPIKNVFHLSRNDFDNLNILQLIKGYNSTKFDGFNYSNSPRAYTNIDYKFEYLKIAEGCDNHCTFCIIPQIRGKQKSLTIENILTQAQDMIKSGIQEIILIAQDTTRYGTDIYGEPALFKLLKELDKLKGDFRYRLLYLYPDIITLKHLEQLKNLKKRIPYFDIPLQHINDSVLKLMGRFYNGLAIQDFLKYIYNNFPTRFVRTNIIVGFPGETEQHFTQLKDFLQESDFDNIALFEYHDEDFATSSQLPDKIDPQTIRNRFLELDNIVDKKLNEKHNINKKQKKTGYVMDIKQKNNITKLIVRPYLHCPDIDPYDTVSLDQISKVYNQTNQIDIGTKIDFL